MDDAVELGTNHEAVSLKADIEENPDIPSTAAQDISKGEPVICSGTTETTMAVQSKPPTCNMQEDMGKGCEATQEVNRTVPADSDDEATGSDNAIADGARTGTTQARCNRTWSAELSLWDGTPAPQLRRVIAGARNQYLNFIRGQTGAQLEVSCAPLKLMVSADTEGCFRRAMFMAQDLIDNTRAEFERSLNEGGDASPTTPPSEPGRSLTGRTGRPPPGGEPATDGALTPALPSPRSSNRPSKPFRFGCAAWQQPVSQQLQRCSTLAAGRAAPARQQVQQRHHPS